MTAIRSDHGQVSKRPARDHPGSNVVVYRPADGAVIEGFDTPSASL
jgi:hypothetical protein